MLNRIIIYRSRSSEGRHSIGTLRTRTKDSNLELACMIPASQLTNTNSLLLLQRAGLTIAPTGTTGHRPARQNRPMWENSKIRSPPQWL